MKEGVGEGGGAEGKGDGRRKTPSAIFRIKPRKRELLIELRNLIFKTFGPNNDGAVAGVAFDFFASCVCVCVCVCAVIVEILLHFDCL